MKSIFHPMPREGVPCLNMGVTTPIWRRSVAVLPMFLSDFARKLQAALEGIGASIAFLYKVPISCHLASGRHAITRMGKLKVYCMLGVSAVITINPAPSLGCLLCSSFSMYVHYSLHGISSIQVDHVKKPVLLFPVLPSWNWFSGMFKDCSMRNLFRRIFRLLASALNPSTPLGSPWHNALLSPHTMFNSPLFAPSDTIPIDPFEILSSNHPCVPLHHSS